MSAGNAKRMKTGLRMFAAIVLIAAQLAAGWGVFPTNEANAADSDSWRLEVSPNPEATGPIFADVLGKFISWQFNTMVDHAYMTPAGLTGNNALRLVGQLEAPFTGEYVFYTSTNDHEKNVNKVDTVRLWLDGDLLIDTTAAPVVGEQASAGVMLESGMNYDIRMEFVARSGVVQSNLKLSWLPPGKTKTHQMKSVTAIADVLPPSTVTDATYGTVSSHAAELVWTAPGSDDIVLEGMGGHPWGTVSSYDIRYSTEEPADPLTWWDNAQPIAVPVTTLKSGERQSVTIDNLSQSTTYYAALKSQDAAGLVSTMSNIVKIQTLEPDNVAPEAVNNLTAASDEDANVTLSWTAPGDDGDVGTATSYELRYDVQPITEASWSTAGVSVAGLPAPLPAGSHSSVTLNLKWAQTYYFAMKTTDKEGNVSGLSNVVEFRTPEMPVGGNGKIPLDASMVYNEGFPHIDVSTRGGSNALVDEQYLAGDPLNGTGGIPVSDVFYGSSSFNAVDQPIVIDLGEDYKIDYIYAYLGAGFPSGSLTISSGRLFHWTPIFSDTNLSGNQWRQIDVRGQNVTTRYLRILSTQPRRNIAEIVLYGTRLGTNRDPAPPERAERTTPLMNEFIGINGFRDDPLDILKVAGNVREYHAWSVDVGSTTNGAVDTDFPNPYPNNINKWNPSYCCDGTMNYDQYFEQLHDAGIMVFPAIQGSVGYLSAEYGDKMVYPVGADPTLPASYAAHADHMFQFTARYGSKQVPDERLKLAGDQPRVSGLGYIEYFEDGNETNAYWGSRSEHFTPYEFAAMLSADYDGHEGTMGDTVGVKNADPNAKMVMAGLAGHSLDYIVGIHKWAKEHRTDGQFPADVLNVHVYANSTGADQSNSVIGVSPEEFHLKELIGEIAEYRDRYLPDKELWVSEFGYDTHPNSPQRAPAIGTFSQQEVQAQWLVRSYLALAAAGVDKAQMYMIRDVSQISTKFHTSGLVTEKGKWDKKISWYYVFTLKNRLMNLKLQGEMASGHPNVNIQTYENQAGDKAAYVVWAPTSNQTEVKGYKLELPPGTLQADLVLLKDKSTVGETSPLTIAADGTVTIDVSERPLFVMLNGASKLSVPEWASNKELSASAITENSVSLSWTGLAPGKLDGYRVFQDGQEIAVLPKGVSTYEATGLQPGTAYRFAVQASEVPGVWGTDGPETTVLTADFTAPSAPANLQSNLVSDTKVSLIWQSSTDNVGVIGYRVYANGQLALTVSGETAFAGLSDLVPNRAYQFAVAAVDAAGNESPLSNEIDIKTDKRPSGGSDSGGGGSAPGNPPTGSQGTADSPKEKQPAAVEVTAKPDSSREGYVAYLVEADELKRAWTSAEAGSSLRIDAAATPLGPGGQAEVIVPASPLLETLLSEQDEAILHVDYGKINYDWTVEQQALRQWMKHPDRQDGIAEIRMNVGEPEAQTARTILESAVEQGITVLGGLHSLSTNAIPARAGAASPGRGAGAPGIAGTLTLDGEIDADHASVVQWDAASRSFRFVPALFRAEGEQTVVRFMPQSSGTYLVVQNAVTFADIGQSWARADIEWLASKRVVSGRNSAVFAPQDTISRAEFAALMVQASGLGGAGAGAVSYVDVSADDWYRQAASLMRQTGMMVGEGGAFLPERGLTREEALVIMARLISYANHASSGDANPQALGVYADEGKISEWARSSIAVMLQAGVLPSGLSNQVFAPKALITREECASLLRKTLQAIGFLNRD